MSQTSPDPEELCRQGIELLNAGLHKPARDRFEEILALAPAHPAANYNLGVLALLLGDAREAVACFKLCLAANPQNIECLCQLVLASLKCAQPGEAAAYLNRAKRLGLPEAELVRLEAELDQHRLRKQHIEIIKLFHEGRYAEALKPAKALCLEHPQEAFGFKALGTLLMRCGRNLEATLNLRKALELEPEDPETLNSLGLALSSLEDLDSAEQAYRKALRIKPDFVEALNNLGLTLKEQGHLCQSVKLQRRAVALAPGFAAGWNNLGNALADMAEFEQAQACFNRAIDLALGQAEILSNQIHAASIDYRLKAEEYLGLARDFGSRTGPIQAATGFKPRSWSGRRLRVGYVSADFRRHPVGYFLAPLLAAHKREDFEIFAFSSSHKSDELSARIKADCEHFRDISQLDDALARDMIADLGIDLLIDLGGHTAGNRLGIFRRRAAPVQAHYLGFLGTTGLTEMDYYICDKSVMPKNEAGLHSEKLWMLPRLWLAYQGPEEAPKPRREAAPGQGVCFASFNNYYKITPQSVKLWSSILHACKDSHLRLKTKWFADPELRQRTLEAFAGQGIAARRIELLPASPSWSEHMAQYNRVDVCLDPVGGLCGMTTTCEALWMGVPVLALEGREMRSRISSAILKQAGCGDWAAKSPERYLELAVRLAQDRELASAKRQAARERLRKSALCDVNALARALENAYQDMCGK